MPIRHSLGFAAPVGDRTPYPLVHITHVCQPRQGYTGDQERDPDIVQQRFTGKSRAKQDGKAHKIADQLASSNNTGIGSGHFPVEQVSGEIEDVEGVRELGFGDRAAYDGTHTARIRGRGDCKGLQAVAHVPDLRKSTGSVTIGRP